MSTLNTSDVGVAAALTQAVGHAGPWTQQELSAIRELELVDAQDISLLSHLEALERLSLHFCDVTDFGAVKELKALTSLWVHACPVAGIDALVGLTALSELHLRYTCVEDVRPLEAMSSLDGVVIEGSPLSEASFDLFARLVSTKGSARRAPLLLTLGDAGCAAYTASLQQRGHALAVERARDGSWLLTRVGSGRQVWTGNIFGVLKSARAAETTESTLEQCVAQGVLRPLHTALVEPPAKEVALAEQADAWTSRSPQDWVALGHFIRQFPDQVFYRFPHGDPRFAVVQEYLPKWWDEQIATFVGAVPVERTLVRFCGFPLCSIPWVSPSMYFNWMVPPQPALPMHCPKHGRLIPIAIGENGTTALCVAATAADPEYIYLANLAGTDSMNIPDDSVVPAFASFSEMLQLVSAIKPRGQPEIVAKDAY